MLKQGNSLGSRSIPPAFNWIVDPLVLNPFLYFDGSENVTTAGGAVSSWSQVIAGDRTLGQLTAGYQPDNATEKSIDFDGSDDRLAFDVAVAQAGVLICATNNGIFAFEVDSTSVDEITALGFETGYFINLDLFAMVLLPTTVTDTQIAGVIKYLERETGATMNPTGSLSSYWWYRTDILTPKFDALDFSGVTTLSGFRFSGLTSFPSVSWDGLTAWGFAYAFWGCSELVSIGTPTGDTSGPQYYINTFSGCSSLTSMPFIDTSKALQFSSTWSSCSSLASFPALDMSSATTFSHCWYLCSSLTSFPALDLSSGTNFAGAWNGCTGLTSFPLADVSSGTTFDDCWRGCTALTSFPALDVSSGTIFKYGWYNCTSLTSFPFLDVSSGSTFKYSWNNCNSLPTFPAGFFDGWNSGTILANCFDNTWGFCDALTEQAVENILRSIAASGQWATDDGTSSGTAIADKQLTIDSDNVDVNDLTAATSTACTALQSRGWDVVINGSIVNEYSLLLNGTDEYVAMTPTVYSTGAFTISAWVKSNGASYYENIIGGDQNRNVCYFGIDAYEEMVVWDIGASAWRTGDVRLTVGKWNHVVLEYDGSTARFYLDGILNSVDLAWGGTADQKKCEFSEIGRIDAGSGRYFDGSISEVAVWDVALDADAIAAVYNSGQPINLGDAKGNYDNEGDLLSWWRMGDNDSGAGEVVTDAVDPALGSELITNGDFASDTNWTKGTGWSIAGGVASCDGTQSAFTTLFQAGVHTAGKLCVLSFDVVSTNGDLIKYWVNGSQNIFQSNLAVGTYEYIFRPTVSGSAMFEVDSTFVGSIDNVSVREVGGNAGLLVNDPLFVVDTPPNYSNYALEFNGSNEYATTSADSTLASKTYSFWSRSGDTGANGVFDHGNYKEGGFHFNYDGTQPIVYIGTGVYRYWADVTQQDDSAWHFWTVVIHSDISNCLLYCDGILQTVTETGTGSALAYTTGLRIGRGGTSYFDGSLDEFAVFDGELTVAQINTIFNAGRPADLDSLSPENWWRMGEDDSGAGATITDQGSEEEDLTLVNTPTYVRTTPNEDATYNYRSISFNGTDEYADCGTGLGDALGDDYAGSLTASMWFKSDSADDRAGIFAIHEDGAHGEIQVSIWDEFLLFQLNGSWRREVAFTDTGWNHVAVVYATGSEADSKMYLNGVAVGSTDGTFPAAADMDFAGLTTTIGEFVNDSYTFDGNIDEVAVFTSELSAAQVLAIYNGGVPFDISEFSPVSWWRMGEDDAEGTIITNLAFATGPDLITNGDFATDSDWTKGTGWTISDGVASKVAGSEGDLYQDAGLDANNTIYEVTFTVSNYSAGTVRTYVGGAGEGIARSANGTYIEQIAVISGPRFYIQGNPSFVGSIDNVVVKKVGGSPAVLVNTPTWSTDSP